jgi:hypothetical protein
VPEEFGDQQGRLSSLSIEPGGAPDHETTDARESSVKVMINQRQQHHLYGARIMGRTSASRWSDSKRCGPHCKHICGVPPHSRLWQAYAALKLSQERQQVRERSTGLHGARGSRVEPDDFMRAGVAGRDSGGTAPRRFCLYKTRRCSECGFPLVLCVHRRSARRLR